MSHVLLAGRFDNQIPPSIGDEDLREAINDLLNYQHNFIQTILSPKQGFTASKFMVIMEEESGYITDNLMPVMVYCPGARPGAVSGRGIMWVKPSIPQNQFLFGVRQMFGLEQIGMGIKEVNVLWFDGNPFRDRDLAARVGTTSWPLERPTLRQILGMIGFTMRGIVNLTLEPTNGPRSHPIEMN